MTDTPTPADLVKQWREDEGGLLAEAKKALSWRSWGFYRWKVMVAFAFWREPTLDPYAIGFGDALLQAADELEAALEMEQAR